ncbi:putative proteinase inhibitor I12, Bowman-Birk [Medicago truncatula]|uniref:Trypsin inhibitor, putative n=1 Tax=Medicago truncatula TaxID=3880 RepID=G7L4L8_MEDTR|nr:trypsin inhibitor, putative [Medicago truncatula]RHN46942.1 putative proteinase inhibitor I12, Bowman-Birk [Medicago truncatula]
MYCYCYLPLHKENKCICKVMESNKNTFVKLSVLLLLLCFTATIVDARFDSTPFTTRVLSNGEDTYDVIYHSACCDKCECYVKEGHFFPQCICRDDGCHSACKKCDCIRDSESETPSCYCADVMFFTCYDLCKFKL